MKKPSWNELVKRMRTSPSDTPDYAWAIGELKLRLTVLGLIIAALAVVVAALRLFI